MIRLPDGMRDQLKGSAEKNNRSMNAEIVDRLEKSFRDTLVLPAGLLERISQYASRRGSSANEEIVRVLEQRFPEQWPVEEKLQELSDLMVALASGSIEPRIHSLVQKLEETVKGIASGRVTGVDLETREAITAAWRDYLEHRAESENEEYAARLNYTEEEEEALELTGVAENYAVPPPRRKKFSEMTDEEKAEFFVSLEKGEGVPKFPPQEREETDDDISF